MRCRDVFFASILSMCAGSAGAVDHRVNEFGRWSDWTFRAAPVSRKQYAVTDGDLGAFETELRALDSLIRRAPAVATPVGFSARTRGHLCEYLRIAPGQPSGAELPLGGALTFAAFPISEYRRGGKAVREARGETQSMDFVVNDIQPTLLGGRQRPHEWRNVDTDAFLQPSVAGSVAGFPRYGDYIVIKKRSDSLWTPVSLEGALRLVIASDRKRLAFLKRTSGPAVEIKNLERKTAGVEAHIAALRPGDRAAASCWTGHGATWGQRFQIGSAPDCRPLVRPNWAFFDRNLPRSAPQVLLVTGIERCYEGKQSDTPAGCAIHRQLLDTLDRQALLDWLR